MNSTTFREVRYRAHRSGPCPVCGRGTTRTRTFSQTVNPWNRHPDGTVKSGPEVYQSVKAEGLAWVPDHTHKKCATERTTP